MTTTISELQAKVQKAAAALKKVHPWNIHWPDIKNELTEAKLALSEERNRVLREGLQTLADGYNLINTSYSGFSITDKLHGLLDTAFPPEVTG